MLRVFTTFLVITTCFSEQIMPNNSIYGDINRHDRILTRKRRYLTFPVGSSIQLVYCFTIPIYGSFVFATTAALAWMLPSTPDDVLPQRLLKNREKNETNRIDKGETSHGNAGSKPTYPLQTVHYYKPIDFGTQFMQFPQPVRYQTISLSPSYRKSYNRKKMYRPVTYTDSYNLPERNVITTYINPVANEWHRRSRRELYGKIEKFFKAQQKDGKACLLKVVCEVNQMDHNQKGTIVQEIIKAIFRTIPSHTGHQDIYDIAGNIRQNCSELYPTCDFSVRDAF